MFGPNKPVRRTQNEALEKELCISCNQAMEISTPPDIAVKTENDDNNECLALDDLPPNLFDSDSE